ncbi:Histidine decarboxylase [Fasciola gigantica]|uniref:Histidine decarboxylase n=1 Tax=Fasciola gigantica TaxID=46835 RepID=A0A504YRB0_FASGI|nr:Histidine decarboxylase [Fasciola gigantica]
MCLIPFQCHRIELMDSKQLQSGLSKLSNFVSQYWTALKSHQIGVLPNFREIKPGYLHALLPEIAPERGEELQTILDDVRDKILPGITHWQHPNFHAYYPTACSSPAILGDLLSSAIAPVGFTWTACPASTELEMIVLDWLAQAMRLPEKFLFSCSNEGKPHFGGGMIECSASLSCATLTMGLRDRKLTQLQSDWNSDKQARLNGHGPGTLVDRMVVYISDQAHSSVSRACRIAMVRCHVITSVAIGKRRVFETNTLSEAIKADTKNGFIPLLCVASLGTTNTCEFDNLSELGEVCRKHDIWLHVDGAYAGAALLCPEYQHYGRGMELADSFCFNPHKLMLVNFDCSVLWLRDHRVLSESFREDPLYLRDTCNSMPEFRNWSINLGRRFRSLKVWFVLRMFGLEHIRSLIRQHVEMAKHFEAVLVEDDRFEIINDVRFGLVCFRLRGENSRTVALQEELLREGRIYLVAGCLPVSNSESDKLYFLRFVCNLQTTMGDVDFACSVLKETTTEVLKQVNAPGQL